MAKCVKCFNELIPYEYNGIKFQLCQTCGTLLITKENFEKLAQFVDNSCKIVDLFELQPVTIKKQARNCPYCNEVMEQVFCEGVLIDRCKKCNLLVFDNGELSKYFSIFSNNTIDIMNNTVFLKTFCSKDNQEKINRESQQKKAEVKMQLQGNEVEKAAPTINGWIMIFFLLVLAGMSFLSFLFVSYAPWILVFTIPILLFCVVALGGFRTLKPQEAIVLTLFGKYAGTMRHAGFYWINPFMTSSFGTISLKARTLDNGQQKINDVLGNPIDVGIMVTWEVYDTAKAIFNVHNYSSFLSAQCDSALRNIVRLYPYDAPEDSNKQSLKDDSTEISEKLKDSIQAAVSSAGIKIIDARITHLAYSSEIAMAMLQRQQANAIIDAKKAIVDGAVSMVEMAIEKLSNNKNIVLDDKTKASMVNNLLVILCGNKESQPVIKNDVN